MKGILFTGGDAPEKYESVKKYIENADIICAADSGIYHAERYRIKPDFIVGDMDSVKNAEDIDKYSSAEILKFNKDKDYTDTELAFSLLKDKNCDEVVIIGGGGGRTDHLLGIFFLFYKNVYPDIWIMEKEIVFSIDNKLSLDTVKGEIISFFPVSEKEARMKSTGLKWELDSLVWKPGSSGISNRAESNKISVEMTAGRLVIMKSL